MNINTLLEIISTDIENKRYSKPFRQPTNPVPHTGLPSSEDDERVKSGTKAGLFNQVRGNKQDPHTVTKRSKAPTKAKQTARMGDVFAEFVIFLNEEDGFSNIYFPKVYNFKTITDPQNKKIYKYTIETLREFDTLSSKQVEFLSNKIFKSLKAGSAEELAQELADMLANYVNNGDKSALNNVKDPELIEAMKMVRKFTRVHNFENETRRALADRSWKNIMYRGTPYGPQVVFADPVFEQKA